MHLSGSTASSGVARFHKLYIDLDAFASEVSRSSFRYRLVSIVEKGGVSSCLGTSSENEQADTSPVLSRFQPWNRPTSLVHISYSQIVLESPSH